MMSDEPPYELSSRGGIFRKEWVQDSLGNWYLQTVVNLENYELSTVDDPLYLRALEG